LGKDSLAPQIFTIPSEKVSENIRGRGSEWKQKANFVLLIAFNSTIDGAAVSPLRGHVGDYYSVISDPNLSYIAQMMAINFNENSLHFDLHRHCHKPLYTNTYSF